MAYIIWAMVGFAIMVLGIYVMTSRKAKPFGFWANIEMKSVKDVKGYNRTLGMLYCAYGLLFLLVGLPLLKGEDSGLIIVPMIGAMFISIMAMVVYVVIIEPKYCQR